MEILSVLCCRWPEQKQSRRMWKLCFVCRGTNGASTLALTCTIRGRICMSYGELWFAIGNRKARFSKREFCLVTRLKFGTLLVVIVNPYKVIPGGIHKQYWGAGSQRQFLIIKACLKGNASLDRVVICSIMEVGGLSRIQSLIKEKIIDRKEKSVVRRGVQRSRTTDKEVHAHFTAIEAPGAIKAVKEGPTINVDGYADEDAVLVDRGSRDMQMHKHWMDEHDGTRNEESIGSGIDLDEVAGINQDIASAHSSPSVAPLKYHLETVNATKAPHPASSPITTSPCPAHITTPLEAPQYDQSTPFPKARLPPQVKDACVSMISKSVQSSYANPLLVQCKAKDALKDRYEFFMKNEQAR
ncbi:Uncharacterized protein TCM_011112 [Theobroma cacao]|uniref:Uncharacterized protein n=1 Tax=Theobroma cacao TaxID=3641 RepID=A0A061EA06_THECC|nr:Uncharacterized protein TCM_011112 [Theobroma cacao]